MIEGQGELNRRSLFFIEFLERGQTYNLLIYHEDGMPEIKADVVDPGKLRTGLFHE